MPLHCQNEVVGRYPFESFDYSVLGASGNDLQSVANNVSRLMMTRVRWHHKAFSCSIARLVKNACELRAGLNLNFVRHRCVSASFMVNARFNMLHQSPRSMNI